MTTTTASLRDRFYPSAHPADRAIPTDKALAFAFRLAGERKAPAYGPDAMKRQDVLADRIESRQPSARELSQLIDWFLRQPPEQPVTVEPGVYESDEGIFVVKKTRDGQRTYAKRLVESPERMTEQDEFVPFDFEYAPGAIMHLRPEHKMPLERAKALRVRYGRCINCGRVLKAAKSVKDAEENGGFGPVCKLAYA